MMESALRYLQEALAHLDKMIDQEKGSLFETEKKLEEISRNIDQYEREKKMVSEAIQQFLGKGVS